MEQADQAHSALMPTMVNQMQESSGTIGDVTSAAAAAAATGTAATQESPANEQEEPTLKEQLSGLFDTVDEEFYHYFTRNMEVIFTVEKPDLITVLEDKDINILKQIRDFLLHLAGTVFTDCLGREPKERRTVRTVCQDIHILGSSILAETQLPDFNTVYKGEARTLQASAATHNNGDTEQYIQTPVEADITQIWHNLDILNRQMRQNAHFIDSTFTSQQLKISNLEADCSVLKDKNDVLNNKIARAESAQARLQTQLKDTMAALAVVKQGMAAGQAQLQTPAPSNQTQAQALPPPPSWLLPTNNSQGQGPPPPPPNTGHHSPASQGMVHTIPPPQTQWLTTPAAAQHVLGAQAVFHNHHNQTQGSPPTAGYHSLGIQGMVNTLPPHTQWLNTAVQHASGAQGVLHVHPNQAQGSPTALQPPLGAQRMPQPAPPQTQGHTIATLPTLSGAPSYNVFIGNLSEAETDTTVHEFVSKRTGTVSEQVVVHEIPQRIPGSKAFKISVPQDKKQTCLNLPWPQRTRVESYSATSNKAGNAQANNNSRNGNNRNRNTSSSNPRNNPSTNNRNNAPPHAFRRPPQQSNVTHGSDNYLPSGLQWPPGPTGTANPNGPTWASGPPWLSGPTGPTAPTSSPSHVWPPSSTGQPGPTGPQHNYNAHHFYQQPPVYQHPFCQPPFYQQPRISY